MSGSGKCEVESPIVLNRPSGRISSIVETALSGTETGRIRPHSTRGKKELEINSIAEDAYTWSSKSMFSFMVTAYVIQKYINEISGDLVIDNEEGKQEFQYDYDKRKVITTYGKFIFSYENKIHVYTIDADSRTSTIKSNYDISTLKETIDHKLKYENPIRNKHLQVVQGYDGFSILYKKVPEVTFDSVILPENIKNDIYDNTIFQIKNLDENNGIILYGEPGVGKSMACQAVISEAIKEGISTCFITTQVNYTSLNEFIENFLSPCIIIFEDIDSFSISREDIKMNSGLADFLQFLSGLSERTDKVVCIATTNYLEHLDKAIKNRPARFNRKFKFELPKNDEIDQLVKVYFKDCEDKLDSSICYDKEFTGAHVKEIHRTATLLSLKKKVDIPGVFEEAVTLVKEAFAPTLIENKIGFGE